MIYFVQRLEGGPIKIGTTVDLFHRLPGLNWQFKCKLIVLAVMNGHRPEEASLHERFHHLNVRDEWFNPAPELMSFIEEHGRQWDGIEHDRPEGGPKTKRCTLILDDVLWDRLKAIEEETGAGPSFTTRRILFQALFDRDSPENSISCTEA